MSRDTDALLALTRFEFRRGLSRQGAWMGALVFGCAVAIGAYAYWLGDEAPGLLFVEGFMVWMMGLVGYGLAIDRRQAFDEYLIRNHITVEEYVAAKVLAMIALILAAAVVALVLRVLATGDPAESLWAVVSLALVALMIAPFAMMIEAHVDTSLPAAIVVLGYTVAGGMMLVLRHSQAVFDATGIGQLATGSWASVAPLAIRTAIALVAGFGVAGALVRLSLRRY